MGSPVPPERPIVPSSSNIHPSLCLSEIITVNSVTGDGCMVLLFQRSFIGSLHYSAQHPTGTSEWPETAFCLFPSKVAQLQKFVLQGFFFFFL